MNILNQLYFLAISHLPASTVATISGALESAFNNNVKPEMKAIGTTIILAPCPVSLNTRPLHRIPVLYKSFFSVCMSLTKH